MKSIRWHAWAAMAVGLAAGWLSRGAIRHELPPPQDPSGKGAAAGRTPAARREAALRSSPTALFLKQTAGIPASRCEELFRELCTQKGYRDVIRLEAVFRRWMELENPKDLLARLAADQEIPRAIWTRPFFEAWAAIDYQAAVTGTAKDGEFSNIRTLVALRRRDPSFLNNSLRSLANYPEGVYALATLGRNDPELARRVATHQGKPDTNASLINAVAAGLASQDPKAALDWVNSLELSDKRRTEALEPILSEWMKIDPAAAAEAFKSSGMAESIKNSGIHDDSLLVLANPEDARTHIYHDIHLDPFLDLAGLHEKLSKAPVDWEKRQFASPPIDSDGWFCTDPAGAAEEATRLPAGKVRDYLMSYICGQWADRNPEDATAFAKLHGLPPPTLRKEPSTEAIRSALAAPEETFASLVTPGKGPIDTNLVNLAQKWAAADPQAAGEWLIAQMDAADKDAAVTTESRIMRANFFGYYWAKVDAVGASEWLENLPPGPRKSEASLAMSSYLEDYSPDLAFTTTAKALDGEFRMRVLGSSIQNVAEKIGSPAARELLGKSDLTPDEQAALGKALDEMKPPARR